MNVHACSGGGSNPLVGGNSYHIPAQAAHLDGMGYCVCEGRNNSNNLLNEGIGMYVGNGGGAFSLAFSVGLLGEELALGSFVPLANNDIRNLNMLPLQKKIAAALFTKVPGLNLPPLLVAALIDVLWVLFSSTATDYGLLGTISLAAALTHWAGILVVIHRRGKSRTRFDVIFIKYGLFGLFVLSTFFACAWNELAWAMRWWHLIGLR